MPEQLRPLAKWLQLNESSLFQARGTDSQTAQRSLKRLPLKVRVFSAVPMANLPAVLPKTRLVFRPADALTFDLVSVSSLLAVLLTQRADDDRYNLLAIVSVSVWLLRTVIRYSNKLMQYDLLLKKFLTSKITQRGSGALGYLSSEGGSQRARRAGLVHAWLLDCNREQDVLLERDWVLREGQKAVNSYIEGDNLANIDMQAALQDLEDLGLILDEAEGKLRVVNGGSEAVDALKRKWVDLFDRS